MNFYQFLTVVAVLVATLVGLTVGNNLQERVPPHEARVNVNGNNELAAGTWKTAEDGLRYFKLRDDFPADHPSLNLTRLLELQALGQDIPELPGANATAECLWENIPIPYGSPTCETTMGSPSIADAFVLAETLWYIGDKGGLCCSPPFLNQKCQTCLTQGSAATDVCNFKEDGGICVCCKQVAQDVFRIKKDCEKWGRAGGYIKHGNYIDINLWHP